MKKKFLVYTQIEDNFNNVAICDTKDLAIKLCREIDSFSADLPKIANKLSENKLNEILDKYPEILQNNYYKYLHENNEYTKYEIKATISFYSKMYYHYYGAYIKELPYIDNNIIDYDNIL